MKKLIDFIKTIKPNVHENSIVSGIVIGAVYCQGVSVWWLLGIPFLLLSTPKSRAEDLL